MRETIRLGLMGAALLLPPAPAYAFDGTAVFGPPVAVLLASAAVAALLLGRAHKRTAAIAQEHDRVAAAWIRAEAMMRSVPAARYTATPAEGERFDAGPLTFLAAVQRLEDLIDGLTPETRPGFETAVARLRGPGEAFSCELRLVAGGETLSAIGRRTPGAVDAAASDCIWFFDATPRARAVAERDGMRAALNAIGLPIWQRGPDLALTGCNPAYAAAIDTEVATAIAGHRELAASVVGENGRALAARARATGKAQSETHHLVIGGARRLVEITEAPAGTAIIGWARDLTDRESAEAELARHIAAHAQVLENLAVAIAIYGPDTRLIFFNLAFARLWQLEEDWLAAKPTLDEVLEQLRERRRLPEYVDFRAFRQQQRAMFTSLLTPQDELLHLPDERTLRLLVSPHPFGGLTFVYEDVTDRLGLERSYNTLIEVQRETLDNLYEAIAVFGSDGRLKLSNPAYAEVWRLAPEDLAGEPHVSEIIEKTRSFFDDGEDWEDRKRRIIARLTAHGASNAPLERRDGSMLQAAIVPLPDGNILLSYLDVTDSTRVENALRERNDALETADRLKSEFIANVSYELRTPLNAIIGFAEMLTHQYFGPLNPRQLEQSEAILTSSNQLLTLINDILDLATVEAGYMTLETQEIDVHTLLSSIVTLSRERARNMGLRLIFDCPPNVGSILGDERRLKQAIFNLISNAVKFTPSGGTVSLAARRQNDEIALEVSDTGVGVARKDQARIFEKFERGQKQSGAGLGLSLVKSFIELHGGHVVLRSEPGAGTTVTCILKSATTVLRRSAAGE